MQQYSGKMYFFFFGFDSITCIPWLIAHYYERNRPIHVNGKCTIVASHEMKQSSDKIYPVSLKVIIL